MVLRLVTKLAEFPITLPEAKAHLRVDHDDDNALIQALIEAATTYGEKFTGRAFIDQTWDFYQDQFPISNGLIDTWPSANGIIEIPRPPLIAIDGVFYAPDDQEFTDYLVDYGGENNPARLYLSASGSWPTPAIQPNAVRVRFRAGYIDADSPPRSAVPAPIKAAIMIHTATLYRFREAMAPGSETSMVPWSAEQLLRQYRVEKSMA